jgi:hypothetical protein
MDEIDQRFLGASKEEIEKRIDAALAKEMVRLASFKENLSVAALKESETVAEAIEMVIAGCVFTDAWHAFLKRVCAGDPMARGQVYVVAQHTTELMTQLSATDPDISRLLDNVARLKKLPDYGPKVRRDWFAKVVKWLVGYVAFVGDQYRYRTQAELPDLVPPPPKWHRWTKRAAKLEPLSKSIWRAFEDQGFLKLMTADGHRPHEIRKMVMRKLQALAAASQRLS